MRAAHSVPVAAEHRPAGGGGLGGGAKAAGRRPKRQRGESPSLEASGEARSVAGERGERAAAERRARPCEQAETKPGSVRLLLAPAGDTAPEEEGAGSSEAGSASALVAPASDAWNRTRGGVVELRV